MRNESFNKLLRTKLKLLFTPCYKRQKYIDDLVMYLTHYKSEFDQESIKELNKQKNVLTSKEVDKLFSESFNEYNFLKFGKARLEVDAYNPIDCRTFAQFNEALRMILLLADFEENLILQS